MPRPDKDAISRADVTTDTCGCGRPIYAIRDGDPVCVDCWITRESAADYDRVFDGGDR